MSCQTHLNFISRFAEEIFRTARLLILIITIRFIDAIWQLETWPTLRHTLVAIESLSILTDEWIFSIRRTVEVGSTVEIDILIVTVLFCIARVWLLIWTSENSFANAAFAIENFTLLTAHGCLSAIVAMKKIPTRRFQCSILIVSLFEILTIVRVCLMTALRHRFVRANSPMNIKHLTFRTLVKLNRISLWALQEESTSKARINVESISTITAELLEFRRFWTVVERVGHAGTLIRIEDRRRSASMTRRFAIVTFHIWFAVFWTLVSMNAIGEELALVRLATSFEIRRPDHFTVHTFSIITDFSIEQHASSTVVIAHHSSGRASKVSTTLLCDIRIETVGFALTRWLVANVWWEHSYENNN